MKIALPLIGIVVAGSNLLGLWATEAQTAAYESEESGGIARGSSGSARSWTTG